MRLHTKVSETDVYTAARKAGVEVENLSRHGSRKRSHAFEVTLSGSGSWANSGGYGAAGHKSATWDEWGIFLDALYRVDAQMVAGEAYQGREHFRWVTGARYDNLRPGAQHKRHRWNPQGRSAGGGYYVSECKCGAILRRLAHGHRWQDVA